MKTKTQRINNIIGQLEGIKKMFEVNSDCISTLTQLKAIRSAVSRVMDTVVEEQFETCMKSLDAKDKKLFMKLKTYVGTN
jgi:DNA-binding FrmR family transcriptional regulator